MRHSASVGNRRGAGWGRPIPRSRSSWRSPCVFDLFLQIFGDGRLTDGQGREVDFRNTIIILTSNIEVGGRGRGGRSRKVGFRAPGTKEGEGAGASKASAVPDDELREALAAYFRPELLGRIGRIVRFWSLEPAAVRGVIEKLLDEVRRRLAEQHVGLVLDEEARALPARLGHTAEHGVRGMEHLIDERIVEPLATALCEGRIKSGTTVEVSAAGDEFLLHPSS
jgi:ATP-dependent Clp protease ATP-binding subunit ClpA